MQLPWYPVAKAQIASPVPGGQQVPLAPPTHSRTHAHAQIHTLAGLGGSMPQIRHLPLNSFSNTLEYRFPASSADTASQQFLCHSFIQWLCLVQQGLDPSPEVEETLPWVFYLSPTNSYALYICLFLYNLEFSLLLTSYSLITPILYYN